MKTKKRQYISIMLSLALLMSTLVGINVNEKKSHAATATTETITFTKFEQSKTTKPISSSKKITKWKAMDVGDNSNACANAKSVTLASNTNNETMIFRVKADKTKTAKAQIKIIATLTDGSSKTHTITCKQTATPATPPPIGGGTGTRVDRKETEKICPTKYVLKENGTLTMTVEITTPKLSAYKANDYFVRVSDGTDPAYGPWTTMPYVLNDSTIAVKQNNKEYWKGNIYIQARAKTKFTNTNTAYIKLDIENYKEIIHYIIYISPEYNSSSQTKDPEPAVVPTAAPSYQTRVIENSRGQAQLYERQECTMTYEKIPCAGTNPNIQVELYTNDGSTNEGSPLKVTPWIYNKPVQAQRTGTTYYMNWSLRLNAKDKYTSATKKTTYVMWYNRYDGVRAGRLIDVYPLGISNQNNGSNATPVPGNTTPGNDNPNNDTVGTNLILAGGRQYDISKEKGTVARLSWANDDKGNVKIHNVKNGGLRFKFSIQDSVLEGEYQVLWYNEASRTWKVLHKRTISQSTKKQYLWEAGFVKSKEYVDKYKMKGKSIPIKVVSVKHGTETDVVYRQAGANDTPRISSISVSGAVGQQTTKVTWNKVANAMGYMVYLVENGTLVTRTALTGQDANYGYFTPKPNTSYGILVFAIMNKNATTKIEDWYSFDSNSLALTFNTGLNGDSISASKVNAV